MPNWDDVKMLKDNGYSNYKIAKKLSTARSTVVNILKSIKNGKTKPLTNPTRIYDKFGITEEEYIKKLQELYDSGMSQRAIAERLGVCTATIENHFKKYEISCRSLHEIGILNGKHCNLTNNQVEALDGMIIADGHLGRSSISSRLVYNCKFRETLLDIEHEFGQMHFSSPNYSKIGKHWGFKSSFYMDLLAHWHRWYDENKVKRVPSDLKITPKFLYWWFVGDGYINKKCVILCTDSFRDECLMRIKKLFLESGMQSSIIPSRRRVKLSRASTKMFIDKIVNNVQISSQYQYKFNKNY